MSGRHRHKDSRGKWLTLAGGDGDYADQPLAQTLAGIEGRLDGLTDSLVQLADRLAALEGEPPPPVPGPEPPPPPPPSSGTFLSYASSSALAYSGSAPAVIEGWSFRNLGPNVIAIRLEGLADVVIRNCDFDSVSEVLYAVNCSRITITDCRYRNITGPHQRDGSNRANFVQFNNVTGGRIARNKGIGGDTEDIVSIYHSNGIVVEDNHFEGTDWTSPSGSGIMVDEGASDNIIRRNTLVNPGQVGIGVAGGSRNRIEDNVIYGEQRPGSNIGLYVERYGSTTPTNTVVTGNRVSWRNAAGAWNPWWVGPNTVGTIFTDNVELRSLVPQRAVL